MEKLSLQIQKPVSKCWCEGHLNSEEHTKYNCKFCSIIKRIFNHEYFENNYQCDHISEKKEEYIKGIYL